MAWGVSDLLNTGGGDMALDLGASSDGTFGGHTFGNISGATVGSKKDWLFGGAGVTQPSGLAVSQMMGAVFVVGLVAVVWLAKGRK